MKTHTPEQLPNFARAQDVQWVKRENARTELGGWEQWRELAEAIRQHTLDNLPHLLTEFSDNVAAQGGKVYFAQTVQEARDYIADIIDQAGVADPHTVVRPSSRRIVKSKSMVTEEIGLNPMLLDMVCSDGARIDLLETDLAEFILQVAGWEEPSHIVVPALHFNRDQIRELFAEKLGYTGDNNPVNLGRFARETMRSKFLVADVAITGCNFAIANTGQINLVTNEGNADLAIAIPRTQIVVMGMERIVPTIAEAEVLDNMLGRSAVGQKVTTYLEFAGIKPDDEADGPEAFHVVIVDNGRSNALGTPFEPVLQCIRCGACLNVCPIYRHIGGHAYGAVYPGPIGAVLSPVLGAGEITPQAAEHRTSEKEAIENLRPGYEKYGELPFWSTLCGACTETCPVKIPLHQLLLEHRRVMVNELGMKPDGNFVDAEMKAVGLGLGHRRLFGLARHGAHTALNLLPKAREVTVSGSLFDDGAVRRAPALAQGWTEVRDLPIPPPPSRSFRHWYRTKNNDAEA